MMLNGMRFRYREWGEDQGAPIVLLHGVLMYADAYDGIAERLSAGGRRVLVLDQRGHGQSNHSSDYSWRAFVNDLEAFWTALGLGPIDVIGHSMGGHHASRFAALHPERVRMLVLVDAPFAADLTPEALTFAAAAAELIPPTGYATPEEFVDLATRLFPRAHRAALVAHSRGLAPGADGRLNWEWMPDFAVIGAPNGAPAAEEEWQLCGQVRCPVLVMRAAESELFPASELDRNVSAFQHATGVDLPNSGHMIMWENPAGVADGALGFFTTRGSSSHGS